MEEEVDGVLRQARDALLYGNVANTQLHVENTFIGELQSLKQSAITHTMLQELATFPA